MAQPRVNQSEMSKVATQIERLRVKRRRLIEQVIAIDAEVVAAGDVLRSILAGATQPALANGSAQFSQIDVAP